MTVSYSRPANQQQSELLVVNSRFITTVDCVTSVDEARRFIAEIRQAMPDANHHVYAYRVGYGNSVIEGMGDDGEPSGTSGPPTLAVLRGSDLGDIALVTTRYFGGTKLGTGGLVRAYTSAAQQALESLKTEVKADKTQIGVEVPYPLYELVKRLINNYTAQIDDETFTEDVTLILTILSSELEDFSAQLQELSAGQITPIILDT